MTKMDVTFNRGSKLDLQQQKRKNQGVDFSSEDEINEPRHRSSELVMDALNQTQVRPCSLDYSVP